MVYMSGSRNARNQSSIVNRFTCGGPKKGGLVPRTGVLAANLSAYQQATNTQFGLICMGNFSNPSQVKATMAGRGMY
jgi:hypothetical protein